MKWIKAIILLAIALGAGASIVAAQQNTSYKEFGSFTVSSASSPVIAIPPGYMTSWYIKPHATYSPCSAGILVWPFTGNSTPTAVPTPGSPGAPGGATELAAGQPLQDFQACSNGNCRDAIGQGWAVALASGSTACQVDAGFR